MISQQELPDYIEKSMPELSGICSQEHCKTTYDIVRQLLKYTTKQVLTHNISTAKKCLQLADKLYTTGNNAVKNAIENVFVYSFTHAFFHDEKQKAEILPIVPSNLYDLYKKQVLYSHL